MYDARIHKIYARITCEGRPQETIFAIEGIKYMALIMGNKIYVPDMAKTTS